MKLDEALAVYLYLKDQYQPSMDQRLAREQAWKIIVQHARATLSMSPAMLCTCAAIGKPNIAHARNCPAMTSQDYRSET
jgi:hypothetical protein